MSDGISILHVDDEPSTRDLTKTFLERSDERFTVETASGADEGLERLAERPPDCIVSDYDMPVMDGIEFLEAVRKQHPDLPFILFTGKGSETVASDAIAAGVTDYLQKSGGSEQYDLLANRIRNAVQARRDANRAERQEQLMRLTEFAGDTGGFELDTETGETLLTEGARRVLNMPDQEHYDFESALEYYHTDDRERIQQTIQRALRTGEQTRGTWRYQHPDGEKQQLLDITYTPATTNGGTTTIRGAIHDVTEQEQRQRQLNSEQRFITQALDAMEDIFYVIDTDGTLQRWNEAASDVTGYSDSELDGMPVIETFSDDDREKIATTVETVLTDGEGEATVEADLLTTDGDRLPYEFTGARLTDENGEPTGLVGIGRDLTDRRQQEQRFQALVEESKDNIFIIDADGIIQYQSPTVERTLGYEPAEMTGNAALDYIHPDDRERLLKQFEERVADPNHEHEPIKYRARHADGSWRWMEINQNNQLNNPAIEGYVLTSRDITERKERERELERTRDLLRNVEQLADVGAWEYDPATGEPMNTAGALRIYGVDPEADLSLEEAFEFYHPEDRDRLRARFKKCLETGESYEVDVRLTRADGEQRWVTAYGERIQQQDTHLLRGYIQDVTEEREQINTLEQIETLFENAQDMLFIIEHSNDEFVVKRVNHAFESATGLSNEELQRKTPQELFGEARGRKIEQRYHKCIKKGESLSYEETLAEEQVPNRDSPTDDGLVYWSTHITPVRVDGDTDWIVGSTRDINEQKRREQRLKRRNERLDEFTSIISHDLRNPLGVAEARLELARDDCNSEHLDDAADAVDRCQALIDDLIRRQP